MTRWDWIWRSIHDLRAAHSWKLHRFIYLLVEWNWKFVVCHFVVWCNREKGIHGNMRTTLNRTITFCGKVKISSCRNEWYRIMHCWQSSIPLNNICFGQVSSAIAIEMAWNDEETMAFSLLYPHTHTRQPSMKDC